MYIIKANRHKTDIISIEAENVEKKEPKANENVDKMNGRKRCIYVDDE